MNNKCYQKGYGTIFLMNAEIAIYKPGVDRWVLNIINQDRKDGHVFYYEAEDTEKYMRYVRLKCEKCGFIFIDRLGRTQISKPKYNSVEFIEKLVNLFIKNTKLYGANTCDEVRDYFLICEVNDS